MSQNFSIYYFMILEAIFANTSHTKNLIDHNQNIEVKVKQSEI